MRVLLTVFSIFLVTFAASGQTSGGANKNEQVKEELRKLFVELNEAFEKRDRAALERIYADEFVWVHANGFVDDRATHINDAFSIEVRTPLQVPNFDGLRVYGDAAINKHILPPAGGRGALYSTSVFARRDGRWQIVHVQGTLMLPERKTVKVDSKILASYVGRYENDAKESLTVTREGDSLLLAVRRAGIPKRTLAATSDTQFFDKLGSEINFSKDEAGRVAHFTIRLLNGREAKWKKVE